MALTIFQRVVKFNKDAGTEVNREELDLQTWVNEINMLEEELDELKMALFQGVEWQYGRNSENPMQRTFALRPTFKEQRSEVADALGDIIYVAMGTMAKLGIDYEKVMNEICTSNETKYTDGVLIKNEVGKIQKGPNFKKPDLSFVENVEQISTSNAKVFNFESVSNNVEQPITTTIKSNV